MDETRRFAGWTSLPSMFFDQAARHGGRTLVAAKADGLYRSRTWGAVAAEVASLARALRAAGIERGDRVALVSENRPEFLIADLAVMTAGAITVPAYTTNTVHDHQHVIENSGARAVIVSTRALAEKVIPAAQNTSSCRMAIGIESLPRHQESGLRLLDWAELMAEGAGGGADVTAWVAAYSRRDPACIIYTSGTGGAPKGVILSHGAILSNCYGAYRLLLPLGLHDQRFLSFLPLSHSYEHTAGQFFPLSIGAQIFYAESAEALGHNMIETHPTLVTAVPRLYEVLHRKILLGVERQSPFRKRSFHRTLELGRRAYEDPASLTLRERMENWLLDLLVRRKVRARFGGKLKAFISGGAPLSYDIAAFFTALGVRVLQGYGQTESAPVISCNGPTDNRLGTVGRPFPGLDVRIADDGEILVRGEAVMEGYWRDPETTAAALAGGWLHTGDIGKIDADGYLVITDRKKDIIVNSGGDNIAPARVEGRLTMERGIAQAMVFGDRKPYLVALIVPDADFVKAWAAERKVAPDLSALSCDGKFVEAVGEAVERVNENLSPIERIRRFAVARAPFSLENGQMTPTLKLRRHKIREAYSEDLERLYGSS